jgi:hypothetical protein
MINRVLVILSGVTGFASAVLAILTAPSPLKTFSLISVFGISFGYFGILVVPELFKKYKARKCLPTCADLEELGKEYRVQPATSRDISWIAGLERSVYSKNDAIPESLLREWYSANPHGFSIIRGLDRKPVGHLDLLPIRPRTMEAFSNGDILECEIRGGFAVF